MKTKESEKEQIKVKMECMKEKSRMINRKQRKMSNIRKTGKQANE